ncbi:MAG: GNAT family N-acetyltransferase [Candidatus Eremiobacteraeota bacterium]|nr:GNAT family N-acetyltransferase [Candidatus Eremiobacteraeota bacterium]
MNDASAHRFPHTIRHGNVETEVRLMNAGDEAAVLAFARALPVHDLLFLPRDITHPKVLEAWVHELEGGSLESLLALREGKVVGCATIVRDPLSWSPHVAEVRVVVGDDSRGQGVGRALMRDAYALALALGAEKIVAQMTADQTAAIAAFESMGFRAEALLRDHVKDREGKKWDIAVLGHDVADERIRADVYGLSEAFAGE